MTRDQAVEIADTLNSNQTGEKRWIHAAQVDNAGNWRVIAKKAVVEPQRVILAGGGNALQLPLQEVKTVRD